MGTGGDGEGAGGDIEGADCVTVEGTGGLWWGHWGAGDDAERGRLGVALERQVRRALGMGCEGTRELGGVTLQVVRVALGTPGSSVPS